MTMTQRDTDALPSVRACVTALPEQLLSPPYEMRSEMNWIDFSGTANPLGTPPSFIRAMEAALAAGELNYPPDREAHALRSVLARKFGLSVESFLVGSTVGDMVRAVAQTYQPCTVGVAVPGPVEYALAAGNAGHRVVEIASPAGFTVPVSGRGRAPRHRVRRRRAGEPGLPHQPPVPPKPTLLAYLDACTWVVVDERSIELTLGGESMVSLVNEHRNLVVVRSLCEPFAMPGIPISYCIAHPDTIAQITRFYDSSCVPMFAEVIGELALTETEHLERTREFLDSEIPGCSACSTSSPASTSSPPRRTTSCARSRRRPRPGARGGEHRRAGPAPAIGRVPRAQAGRNSRVEDSRYFCVAVRTREDNEKLVAALREIVVGC